jgi:hypothetical protein
VTYSALHDGLALCLARRLRALWHYPLVVAVVDDVDADQDARLESRVDVVGLEV